MFYFRHEGQHGAEDFAEWGDVVVADPGGEFHQIVVQQGRGVEDGDDGLGFDWRWLFMHASDDAGELFIAEGNDDATADCRRLCLVVHAVGEDAIERDWQGYVAEVGHDVQLLVVSPQSSSTECSLTTED